MRFTRITASSAAANHVIKGTTTAGQNALGGATATAPCSGQTAPTGLSPRFARALYRSFLRASHHGQYPQVFGPYGVNVFQAQLQLQNQEHEHEPLEQEQISLSVPTKALHVRQRLKSWFRNPHLIDSSSSSTTDTTSSSTILSSHHALEALRHVQEQSAMMMITRPLPRTKERAPPTTTTTNTDIIATNQNNNRKKPPVLPIFDYNGIAALPGELMQTRFVSERYRHHLAKTVLESPGKLFLLRPAPSLSSSTHGHNNKSPTTTTSETSAATLVQLVSHLELFDGTMAVTCRGGPRVTIVAEDQELVSVIREHSNHWLSHATDYHWRSDHNTDNIMMLSNSTMTTRQDQQEQQDQQRQYLLDMLRCLLPHQNCDFMTTLQWFGLPPPDMEAFSFWALRYVLAREDVKGRLYWLHDCHDTQERLDFCRSEIESVWMSVFVKDHVLEEISNTMEASSSSSSSVRYG